MSEQEKAFWDWWSKVENHQHLYTLRMAFDAGYESSKDNG
jgi:hypothetical protein